MRLVRLDRAIFSDRNIIDDTVACALQPMEVDPNTIRAWLLTSGTMLCADQSFLDYAGWEPDELVGKAFSSLGVDSGELDE